MVFSDSCYWWCYCIKRRYSYLDIHILKGGWYTWVDLEVIVVVVDLDAVAEEGGWYTWVDLEVIVVVVDNDVV